FLLCPAVIRGQDDPSLPPPPRPLPTPKPRPAPTDTDGWKIIYIPRGSFRMPAEPLAMTDELETAIGRLAIRNYLLETPDANYMFGYIEFPVTVTDPRIIWNSMDAALREMRAKNPNLKILSERNAMVAGYPGKEWTLQSADTILQSKSLMAGRTVYSMMLGTPRSRVFKSDKGGDTPANRREDYQAASKKFFDSLRLYNSGVDLPTVPVGPEGPIVRAPITGGVLNGRAISLPKPAYPEDARARRITGTVVVQITFDEEGKVIKAYVVSGHPLLREAAKKAARQARFKPVILQGKPVKVTGVLTYNFAF
ncbi:MAG: energy transducer TonB, partial [Acidobacteria bacterium]|nr:energy transducer TonB [Acidobacteriota bacterium]